MRNGYRLIPEEFSSLAYETVFKDSSIYSGYAVSIFVTVVGTCMALVLCGMAGYAMSLQRVKYRNTISMYFYIPMVFNAGLLPWYLVCTQLLHLQDTIWALILPSLVSPFNVFLMRNYFKTIPSSLVESAEIDGSGPIRTFFQIVIPLALSLIHIYSRGTRFFQSSSSGSRKPYRPSANGPLYPARRYIDSLA